MRRLLIAGVLMAIAYQGAQAARSPAVGQRLAEPAPEHRLEFAAVDVDRLLAEDAAGRRGGPLRYGVTKHAGRRLVEPGLSASDWQQLDDGRLVRRWQVRVPNALSLDFLLSEYWLPHGAELYVYDAASSLVRGPYTDRHNLPGGVLPLPFVPGERALIEVVAPVELASYVKLELGQVTAAYRPLWELESADKSGSCNVDVVCPEGDDWRDEIRSVARYSFNGFLCSGQLIDNTSRDGTPYFLTANHCVSTAGDAQAMVFYFNYESPNCRTPGSGASGTPIGLAGFNDTVSGATLRATNDNSDFTLVELSQAPPASYNTFVNGWDRDEAAPNAVTTIHHPQGDAKRISFENDPVCASTYLQDCGGDQTNWRVGDWDVGTTEGGSSGSGLWNEAKRLIGQLQGGFAACGNDEPDWYGRLSVSWDSGASASSRLRDWLDPGNTNAQFLDSAGGCSAPQVSISSSKGAAAVAGELVTYSASVSGGQTPYSFEWDVDGDGISDGTGASIQARYPGAFSGNVSVEVTDGTGCQGSSSFGAVVRAPQIDFSDFGNVTQVCGDNDSVIESGEHIGVEIILVNNGDATSPAGFAAFDIDEGVSPGEAVLAAGAFPIPALAARATTTVGLVLEISDQFNCGDDLGFRLLGTAHAGGFSVPGDNILLVAPTGPTCDSTVVCTTPLQPDFLPKQGFWYNALRSGNGLDIHFANFAAGLGVYSAWYTALANRLPIWYYLQTLDLDQLINNQVRTDVLQFKLDGDIVDVVPTFTNVGSTKFSFIDDSTAVMTWTINGQPNGELIQFFDLAATPVNETLTDQYFNPAESGWGFGLHRQGNQEFSAIYFYGTDGEPSWTVVSSDGSVLVNQGDADLASFKAHCPGCVWTPAQIIPGGTMSRTLSSDGSMVLDSMDVSIQGEVNIEWQRSNLPMIQIVPE